ncbi:uncharacterized oxidoreductase [Filimonas lacunae]|uniref:Uncharacterized oxidoreductase n=1 Tax=Filimonas lacunae TaxID=477680 RepID=A0A173MFM9_9BACT|nr:SDR family NAD(P)-dependent oxidoreductase [Filimonas lacunae]BAV06306.1 sorbitol-6-phosphate 2-dehydrogenase [Filimonas lacunae]SIT25733.1 uncharacterized oxidoreductase [Filimonas lacunae]
MQLKNSTVLITGGSNGIGLEFAKQLMQQGATVIITGRDMAKLQKTRQQFPYLHVIQSNVNNPKDIEEMYEIVTRQFPHLKIIINNAGIMRTVKLMDDSVTIENVTDEIETNFSGTVRMIHQFLPHLMQQQSAAIINITSGLAFIPFTISPLYCGTKAAVHVYSQALRLQLKNSSVKVFEVAPPKTDNPLQTAFVEQENDGRTMKVSDLVAASIKGILKDQYEIRPGLANVMKWMSRIAPGFFTKMINRNLEKRLNKQH